ncbi:hypothetical protein THRCLA_22908 [Thraustotheca clavata]|uniref:Peptidase A2 domain-containing protein n=1 Tax=Thraustotheca clavata TaxID=74557 RepID=A0A1V9YPV5_9STRA|nr:hypothetical protein THRCLA_22908 [Thraustotheca clavata]
MSELDKVTWFNRSLRSKTKSVALEYERTHFQGGEDRDRERPQHATHKTNYVQQRPNMQRLQQSQPSQSQYFNDLAKVASATSQENELFIINGQVNGKSIRLLLDSGADHNILRRGLGSNPHQSLTFKKFVKTCALTACFSSLTERELSARDYDGILGKPWFCKWNPTIDWCRHILKAVDPSRDDNGKPVMKSQRISVCFREIKVGSSVHLLAKSALLEEFADVFPETLPEGLPPSRAVDYDVIMKSDAKPQAHPATFRLFHMEHKLLDKFVDNTMEKGWVQVQQQPMDCKRFWSPQAIG